MITIELQMQILDQSTRGHSVRQIASDLHLSPTTVQAWTRKLKPQIDRARFDQDQEHRRQLGIDTDTLLTVLAQEFQAIRTTLQTDGPRMSFSTRTRFSSLLFRAIDHIRKLAPPPESAFDPNNEMDQYLIQADPLPDPDPVELTLEPKLEPKLAQKTEPPTDLPAPPPTDPTKTDTKLVQQPEPVTVLPEIEEERLRKEQLSRIAGQIQTLIAQKQQT